MGSAISTVSSRWASRYRGASPVARVGAIVSLGVIGSGLFCYTLYLIVGLPFTFGDTGGAVALLAPLVTPAVVSPIVMIPIERSNRRSLRLLAEVETTRAQLAAEIAVRKAAQERLEHQVRHDPLTGVLNRRGLFEACQSRPADPMTLYTVDVDRFKQVNDRWGHQTGDEVLKAVALALTKAVGDTGWVARTGGDEFVVVHGAAKAEPGITSALRGIVVPLDGGEVCEVGASVGHAPLPAGASIDHAFSVADHDMFSSKRARRSDRPRLSTYTAEQAG